VCRIAKNENEVRELLGKIWAGTNKSEDLLVEVTEKNEEVSEFESMLKETK